MSDNGGGYVDVEDDFEVESEHEQVVEEDEVYDDDADFAESDGGGYSDDAFDD